MADQGPCRSTRMQWFPSEEDYPPFPPSPNNPTNGGSIEETVGSNMDTVNLLDHQEGMVKTIKEGFLSPTNPLLIDPLGPPLAELPSSNLYLHQISIFR